MLALLALMALLSVAERLSGAGDDGERKEALPLLHEVAMFQMELLSRALAEAAQPAAGADKLAALRQSAYAAKFAHERLTLAVGKNRLPDLACLPLLMEAAIRPTLGGGRPLRPEEAETLRRALPLAQAMFDVYGKLLTSSGEPVASSIDKLRKLDGEMAKLLKEAG